MHSIHQLYTYLFKMSKAEKITRLWVTILSSLAMVKFSHWCNENADSTNISFAKLNNHCDRRMS